MVVQAVEYVSRTADHMLALVTTIRLPEIKLVESGSVTLHQKVLTNYWGRGSLNGSSEQDNSNYTQNIFVYNLVFRGLSVKGDTSLNFASIIKNFHFISFHQLVCRCKLNFLNLFFRLRLKNFVETYLGNRKSLNFNFSKTNIKESLLYNTERKLILVI